MDQPRLRFAPSPTGALHIGGVRTALYNYLLARKYKGTFILRIEDTDQTRYVPGAEEYIIEALDWCGLTPDEGPITGGDHGPYRQSERRELYQKYAQQLIDGGRAYYAFDTPAELDARREAEKEKGNHTFKYDQQARMSMRNSLSLPEGEVKKLLEEGAAYTVRLKVPEGETILVQDLIRGEVSFDTNELDDKVLLKADGLPTYHLANIVDDHLMEITHVVRGEEWLPSTAHHVLLYQSFGWEPPQFAHLPLILKPTGSGKLSKRDGKKLGIPVFPLSWKGATEEGSFEGFREFGFDPRAVLNFLAFLGWNPGTEQEIFSLEELAEAFSVDHIGKSGARFDFDKALWYNQQYIIDTPDEELATTVRPLIEARGHKPHEDFLRTFVHLFKERVHRYPEFWEQGYYFFEPVREYQEKPIRKKWKPERAATLNLLLDQLQALEPFTPEKIEAAVKQFLEDQGLGFGDVLPFFRLGLAGTMKGPGVFDMVALMGKEKALARLREAWPVFNQIKDNN